MSSSSPNRHPVFGDRSGFTLMELVIAIFVLMLMSVGIFQAIWETFRLRDTLLVEGDFYNAIRLSTDLLRRDINLMYSPMLMAPPKPSPSPGAVPGDPYAAFAGANSNDLGDLMVAKDYWGPAIDATGLRPSRFVGTDRKLTFIAASHIRVYKDSPESDLAKVSYELVEDRSAIDGVEGSLLLKTTSPNAFDLESDRDKYVVTLPLLHGVKSLRFRFYRLSNKTWYNNWDTEQEDFRNIFPDMIELALEVNGPQRLSHEGLYLFRPEVPLDGIHASF